MKKIAILASGNGSNAEEIIKHFKNAEAAEVALIISNKPDAFVLKRAENHNIPSKVISRKQLQDGDLLPVLKHYEIDFIVLAGFLLLIPQYLVKAFPNKIINIHPALLPKYGGKGMYGDRVHQAVKESGDKETGITIHFVNENYDEGEVIFQGKCEVLPNDTPEQIAKKVHQLEYKYFPKIIEQVLLDQ